jgi:Vacuolar sorting protein 39 domain 1
VTSSSMPENFQGPEHTILYLQKLKGEDIDLIFEFARWPLQENEQLTMEAAFSLIQLMADISRRHP